jgi:hypothetical protein
MGDGTHKLPVQADVRRVISKEAGAKVSIHLEERLTGKRRRRAQHPALALTGLGQHRHQALSQNDRLARHLVALPYRGSARTVDGDR